VRRSSSAKTYGARITLYKLQLWIRAAANGAKKQALLFLQCKLLIVPDNLRRDPRNRRRDPRDQKRKTRAVARETWRGSLR